MPQPDDATSNFSAAVIASSPDAIIAVDMDGVITAWNPAAENMMGFPADEAIGRDLLSLMPGSQRDAAARLLERARNGEVIAGRDVTRNRRDGSTVVGRLTVAPIRAADGAVCGTVGIMHDTTERKAIEELLQRNHRLASIGTLAAGIAHEINNPVGGILMAAQYAKGALDRPDSRGIIEKALTDIEVDAKRCSDIVRGLLRFAHEESGERQPCNLNEVAESAINLSQKSFFDSSADISFTPAESLPSVIANGTEIRQALVNLIVNALQSESSAVSLVVGLADGGEAVEVCVRDDGNGIPEEVIDHLFDPFFTTKRRQGGTGLGLSLAHAIVTDHGGTLDVASSGAEGTAVRLQLPLPRGTE